MKPTYENLERFVDWAEFLGCNERDAFDLAARIFDHFGVEEISAGNGSALYLNQGDTYDTTLVYDHFTGLLITSWGSWMEAEEEAYCEEFDVTRCGYCGGFTECDEYWEETTCTTCGNCVAG